MIYAIATMVIVSVFSLLLISYFGMNNMQLDKLKIRAIAKLYCDNGLSILSVPDKEYDKQYEDILDDAYNLKVYKTLWGGYALYVATVLNNKGDTLYSKIALAGQAPANEKIALIIHNSATQPYIGANAIVNGHCYIPGGYLKNYPGYKSAPSIAMLHPAPDTPVYLKQQKLLFAFLKKVQSPSTGRYMMFSDSVNNSFYNPVYTISADTVFLKGSLQGNIVVCARYIYVSKLADVQNIILTAGTIRFEEGFTGSLQAFASDSILSEKHCRFIYPSTMALMPDVFGSKKQGGIWLGDSCTLLGVLYANSSQNNIVMKTGRGIKILGGIYSSSSIQANGQCYGSIVCTGIKDIASLQDNLIANIHIDVDSLPTYYGYDMLYPVAAKTTIVKWCETKYR